MDSDFARNLEGIFESAYNQLAEVSMIRESYLPNLL